MLIFGLAMLLALLVPAAAADTGVVRAIFFFDHECPACQRTLKNVMPPIHAKYGDRLQITYLEISEVHNYDLFLAAGKQYEIAREKLGVPFIVIGDRAIIGEDEIRTRLPAEIEACLARDGVDYPALAGLDPRNLVPGPPPNAFEEATSRQADPIANNMAVAVLAAMILAISFVGVGTVRSMGRHGGLALPDESPMRRGWERWSIPLLALIGLGISGYLTYVKLAHSAAICGPVGDCDAVQNSVYSQVAGVPVAFLGFLSYLVILGLWAWGEFGRGELKIYAPLALLGVALTGTIYSAYLTALEPFVIGAVCMWCIGSAVTITLIMLVAARPIWRVPNADDRHFT